jgi:hypothetical protein
MEDGEKSISFFFETQSLLFHLKISANSVFYCEVFVLYFEFNYAIIWAQSNSEENINVKYPVIEERTWL